MFYVLDVAGFRNYLLVPGLPVGLQRSGKNYPTSPLMYLLVGGRLRDSFLVLWWIIFNWTLSLLQIWKTDVGDPRSPLLSLVMNAWLGDLSRQRREKKENRPFFSSHYRPIIAQQNDEGRLLSNGNCGLHSESYSSRGLGGFYRLYGRIPPYSYSSSVSQVPEIFP